MAGEVAAEGSADEATNHAIAYITLSLVVLFVAAGNILQRYTRDLDNTAVAAWTTLLAGPFLVVVLYSTGGALEAWKGYTTLDFQLLTLSGLTYLLAQIFRFQAFRYEEIARVQPIQLLLPAWQLLSSILLFDVAFNLWQILGVVIVFGTFLVNLMINVFIRRF